MNSTTKTLSDLSDFDFYSIVNQTSQSKVLAAAVEVASLSQCEFLSQYGSDEKIALMFANKLLPLSTHEVCFRLSKFGLTPDVAHKFAKHFIEHSTAKQSVHLSQYGRSPLIRDMFSLHTKNSFISKELSSLLEKI